MRTIKTYFKRAPFYNAFTTTYLFKSVSLTVRWSSVINCNEPFLRIKDQREIFALDAALQRG